MVVRQPRLPAYIRLSAIKELGATLPALVGSPMVYEAVTWVKENFGRIVTSPPPLKSLLLRPSADADVADDWEAAVDDQDNDNTSSAIPATSEQRSGSGGDGRRDQSQRGGRKGRRGGSGAATNAGASGSDSAKNAEVSARLQAALEAKQSDAKYQKMQATRRRLPAYKQREEVAELIRQSACVVVVGETGCGKTTQVPQFVLDDLVSRGEGAACNIVCTQPRRLAAMSVAQRVAAERAEAVGGTVGYKIRLESKAGADTRLMFCTTGILLRRLQGDPELTGVSHVIVDEVHERSVDGDFLLVLLRQLLRRRRGRGGSDFKVVLMSATIDEALFASYFDSAPVVNIPGFTHPVTEVFLEELLERCGVPPSVAALRERTRSRKHKQEDEEKLEAWREACAARGLSENVVGALECMASPLSAGTSGGGGSYTYDLIAQVVAHIVDTTDSGAVLVFLQGIAEIK